MLEKIARRKSFCELLTKKFFLSGEALKVSSKKKVQHESDAILTTDFEIRNEKLEEVKVLGEKWNNLVVDKDDEDL